MNKTVISNISGLIFHLNEDAYDKLNNYLQTIGSFFKDSEGRAEIMTDIEARIAEMFKSKITVANQVITIADVDEAIAVMGQPEEFLDGQEPPPKTVTGKQSVRRIFRDPDERILGGVCSGLSTYFGINDPIWLRLIFVILFFMFGTGPLIYIILWIIIPVAKTASEKLEMKGEPVNVSNISKTIHEEFSGIKKKIDEFSSDAKNIKSGPFYDRVRNVAHHMFNLILDLIRLIIRVITKFFGFILIFIATLFLIIITGFFIGDNGLFSAGTEGFSHFSLNDTFIYFFNSEDQLTWAKTGIFIILFIPFFLLLVSGAKILFGIKRKLKTLGAVMLVFWFTGLALLIFITFQLSSEFSSKASVLSYITPVQPSGNILYIGMEEPKIGIFSFGPNSHKHIFRVTNDHLLVGYPKLNFVRAETDSFKIIISHTSHGCNRNDATQRSKRIGYNYTQRDSLVIFDGFYRIDPDDKYRCQQVYITVKIPEGKSVDIDPSLEYMLYDIQNTNNLHDKYIAGKKWKMTHEGLSCENC